MGISGNVIQSRNNMLYVKMALQDFAIEGTTLK